MLPNNESPGYSYVAYDCLSREEFDEDLLIALRDHHLATASVVRENGDRKFGHRFMTAFLPNNRRGELRVFSGIIIYQEVENTEE